MRQKSIYYEKIIFPIVLYSFCLILPTGYRGKKKEIAAFADKISSFIEADQIDSLHFYYPTANFDSLSFAVTEKPQIRDAEEAGKWKVN